jgi:hypothetical protein
LKLWVLSPDWNVTEVVVVHAASFPPVVLALVQKWNVPVALLVRLTVTVFEGWAVDPAVVRFPPRSKSWREIVFEMVPAVNVRDGVLKATLAGGPRRMLKELEGEVVQEVVPLSPQTLATVGRIV